MKDMSAENYIERPEVSYTQVPNELIADFPKFNEMGVDGLRAQSLLFLIYSKPRTWRFYRKNLAEEMKLSHRTFDRVIKAAKDSGWLDIELVGHAPHTGRPTYKWSVKIPTPTPSGVVSPVAGDDPSPVAGDDPSPVAGEHSKTIISKTNLGRLNKDFSPAEKNPSYGDKFTTLGWIASKVFGHSKLSEVELEHREVDKVSVWLELLKAAGRYTSDAVEPLRQLQAQGYPMREALEELGVI